MLQQPGQQYWSKIISCNAALYIRKWSVLCFVWNQCYELSLLQPMKHVGSIRGTIYSHSFGNQTQIISLSFLSHLTFFIFKTRHFNVGQANHKLLPPKCWGRQSSGCVACTYKNTSVCPVPSQPKECIRILWNWNYRWLTCWCWKQNSKCWSVLDDQALLNSLVASLLPFE